jgi:hypothetical protein
MTTTERAAVQILKAVVETIVEAGDAGIPAGHLYATLSTQGCTLHQYSQIEETLIWSGLVVKDEHRVLRAVEKKEAA